MEERKDSFGSKCVVCVVFFTMELIAVLMMAMLLLVYSLPVMVFFISILMFRIEAGCWPKKI